MKKIWLLCVAFLLSGYILGNVMPYGSRVETNYEWIKEMNLYSLGLNMYYVTDLVDKTLEANGFSKTGNTLKTQLEILEQTEAFRATADLYAKGNSELDMAFVLMNSANSKLLHIVRKNRDGNIDEDELMFMNTYYSIAKQFKSLIDRLLHKQQIKNHEIKEIIAALQKI